MSKIELEGAKRIYLPEAVVKELPEGAPDYYIKLCVKPMAERGVIVAMRAFKIIFYNDKNHVGLFKDIDKILTEAEVETVDKKDEETIEYHPINLITQGYMLNYKMEGCLLQVTNPRTNQVLGLQGEIPMVVLGVEDQVLANGTVKSGYGESPAGIFKRMRRSKTMIFVEIQDGGVLDLPDGDEPDADEKPVIRGRR